MCQIDALILENWEVKGRRDENWKIPTVPLLSLPLLLLSPLPPFLVSFPSLHRITVSDGTGLTVRRRSKKTVALSTSLKMTCDTCTHTHTRFLVGVSDDITGSMHQHSMWSRKLGHSKL